MPELVRNKQLDGLRGYASVAVVIFHCVLDRDRTFEHRIVRPAFDEIHGIYNLVSKLVFIVLNGEAAVVLFFVLSGAVLFDSLRSRDGFSLSSATGFVMRRFFRLYPAFAVALVCAFAASIAVGGDVLEPLPIWENFALIDFSVLGTSWTLQIEFLAIPFLLAAYWAYRRWGAAGIVLVYFCFFGVLSISALHDHLILFARFLPCFVWGMLIPTDLGRKILTRCPGRLASVSAVAMLSVRSVLGLHWWSAMAEEFFAAILIGTIYYRRSERMAVWLEAPLAQYFGRVSYSLYLFHVVFLTLADRWTRDWPIVGAHPLEMGLLLSIPVLACSLLVAHVSERVLERPSISLGHRFSGKRAVFA